MKVRNGFVSNSSSSSFLIVYNNLEDFAPFRLFEKGYNRLMQDIPQSTDENVIGYIESLISNYFYQLKEIYTKELYAEEKNYDDHFDFYYSNQFNTFVCDLGIPSAIVEKKEKALQQAADESIDALNTTYDKIEDEGFRKEAEKILEFLKKMFCLAAIEYEDHDDIGSYMEHDFMPFIRHNPDDTFAVFVQNNH